jgi:hypothetical protein
MNAIGMDGTYLSCFKIREIHYKTVTDTFFVFDFVHLIKYIFVFFFTKIITKYNLYVCKINSNEANI